MSVEEQALRNHVMRDMSEGVLLVSANGSIAFVNPAAERILGISAAELLGGKFFRSFMLSGENDAFSEAIIDAVYDKSRVHNEIVSYHIGGAVRRLHMVTSFLFEEARQAGVIIVLDDITELVELRIEHARQMTELLDSLVGALSTAIEERSLYNANHTRNMVRYAERFLDRMAESDGGAWRFDEERRRAFLMSVWLHDVGKLAVPLSVMDKATRLGPGLSEVRHRFTEIGLLDRIALLEGRIDASEAERRQRRREEAMALVERVNTAGFLPDADLDAVNEIGERTYTDESGTERPWLTEGELTALRVRRGTLTDEERAVMQSHVVVTEHILSRVKFPEIYAEVPAWASAHHERLNGSGYPRGLSAEDIPPEVRLLTVLDVFEALTARDRPYKPGMSVEKALAILRSMAGEGAVDAGVLDSFERSRAWEG